MNLSSPLSANPPAHYCAAHRPFPISPTVHAFNTSAATSASIFDSTIPCDDGGPSLFTSGGSIEAQLAVCKRLNTSTTEPGFRTFFRRSICRERRLLYGCVSPVLRPLSSCVGASSVRGWLLFTALSDALSRHSAALYHSRGPCDSAGYKRRASD